jgi:ATP-dependent DNA helicase RecG
MLITAPVTHLTGVGPQRAAELEEMGITKVGDLLQHLPIRYLDASQTSELETVQDGELVTVHVELTKIETVRRRGGRSFVKVDASDGTDIVQILFFNQPYRARSLHTSERWAVTGKAKKQGSRVSFMNPTLERLGTSYTAIFTGRVLPIYPQHGSINTRWLQRILMELKPYIKTWFPEYLPAETLQSEQMMSRPVAWEAIHFPESGIQAEEARRRLAFDELWEIFAGLENEESERQIHQSLAKITAEQAKELWQKFLTISPFPPTPTQEEAMRRVLSELQRDYPLRQLVFGEVGSGKTLVAALALMAVASQGKQALYLAPTTVLAQQHYTTVSTMAEKWGLTTSLWLGSQKGTATDSIIIGTHALLHGSQQFDPALIIVDEEHRFGVRQREHSWGENVVPHHMTMTATPIPRTLAHLLYGNQSFSALEPIPGQIRQVTTRVVAHTKLGTHWQWLEEQVATGQQAFVITPLIEPSETPGMEDIAAASAVYAHAQVAAPNIRWGILTGKTPAKEKDAILNRLRTHELDAIVATPVIEVGVDIPDASVITILSAERFGFAQLHQLRGRVGRRGQASWCFLVPTNGQGGDRLKTLETISNGAELAELDLQRRGAGEFFGLRQHGWDGLQIATWFDLKLLQKVKDVREKTREKLS